MLVCSNDACEVSNRDIAKFCKVCGEQILLNDGEWLKGFIGHKNIKGKLLRLRNVCQNRAKDKRNIQFNNHVLIIGSEGTGKSILINKILDMYFSSKVISKRTPQTIDPVSFEQFFSDFEKNYQKVDGAILVDEADKYFDEGSYELKSINKLLTRMKKNSNTPTVIFSGKTEVLNKLYENNTEFRNLFGTHFTLNKLTSEDLLKITLDLLDTNDFLISENAISRLESRVNYLYGRPEEGQVNGHIAVGLTNHIMQEYFLRQDTVLLEDTDPIILEKDIKGEVLTKKTISEVLASLNDFIGMKEIKNKIKTIAKRIELEKKRVALGASVEPFAMHMVITGNPGTGKSTIVRKLGEVFHAIGILGSAEVLEVSQSDMVGQYVGSTAKKVDALCDLAMGGILFIDEAYTLSPDIDSGMSGGYGQEAIDQLLKRMEDDRGKFIVIVAGYPEEMKRFIGSNSGLQSRFNEYIHFEDYTPEELLEIFKLKADKQGYGLGEGVEDYLNKVFKEIYSRRTKTFANGREVRTLLDDCINNFAERVQGDEELILEQRDIAYDMTSKDISEVLASLDDFIGMKEIKSWIETIVNRVELNKRHSQSGINVEPLALHIVLTGNPGTGKTTVVEKLGEVFHAMGVLGSSEVLEVNQSKMVGQYVGSTPKKVDTICDQAMGGILFIDEAYTLSPDIDSGMSGGYGQEAIEQLMIRMENDRGKFIVIVAGYQEEMERFLSSNPGLESRFTDSFHFEDYIPKELLDIFKLMANKQGYGLGEGVEGYLNKVFKEIYSRRTKTFANGREVRNLLNKSINKFAERVQGDEELVLEQGDIAYDI